jgi:hypothetical protein
MNAQGLPRRRREIILSPRLGETLIVATINGFARNSLDIRLSAPGRTSSVGAAACN